MTPRQRQVMDALMIGRSQKSVAAELGISQSRVWQICRQTKLRLEQTGNTLHCCSHLSRPIDMGGPRDVWMTYRPGPDPHLDYMEPAMLIRLRHTAPKY